VKATRWPTVAGLLTGLCAWLATAHGWAATVGDRPELGLEPQQREFLNRHCAECHSGETVEGGVRLDILPNAIASVADAARWQEVLRVVNAGDMPPDEARQPTAEDKTEFLGHLTHALEAARRLLADEGGRTTMRRLNRREYANSIRALLGVDVDVADLPADQSADAFDTAGASLFMSDDQFERYLEIAARALRETFSCTTPVPPSPLRKRLEPEEQANATHRDFIAFTEQAHAKYHAWAGAVFAALAKPENAELSQRIFQDPRVRGDAEHLYRRLEDYTIWSQIKGLPDPTDERFNGSAGLYRKLAYDRTYRYLVEYWSLPQHATGVCLTTYTGPKEVDIEADRNWPSGMYKLRCRLAALDAAPPERRFLEIGHRGGSPDDFQPLAVHHVVGSVTEPETLEIDVALAATNPGPRLDLRRFSLREKRPYSFAEVERRFVQYKSQHDTGPKPAIWIDWVELEGPLSSPAGERLQDILFPRPDELGEQEYAREVIARFATRAFRDRSPEPEFIAGLLDLFTSAREAAAPFEAAIQEPLALVLASPSFLYLREPGSDAERRPLDARELAVRLAYFLWSAPPDEALLSLARDGTLADEAVLAAQADRMLADPRANAFFTSFTSQWLGMERLDFFRFNQQLFPDFDEAMQAAVRSEVPETFKHVMLENAPLTDLLRADYCVVNALVARYYGWDGVEGDAFRKVAVPADSPRGGLLGMAAIQAMGNNGGEVSNPANRGAWVLRVLLDDPPPKPPANIPQLDRLNGKLVTTRERLVMHQEEPQCASCHRKIDPIGFGLENFDAVGRWRTTDSYERAGIGRKEWEIDPAGQFFKGPAFASYFELRSHVAEHRDEFSRGFVRNLMAYALGRAFGFTDTATADAILAEARGQDYAARSFLRGVVTSKEFRTK
jgi:hypothetical protein